MEQLHQGFCFHKDRRRIFHGMHPDLLVPELCIQIETDLMIRGTKKAQRCHGALFHTDISLQVGF